VSESENVIKISLRSAEDVCPVNIFDVANKSLLITSRERFYPKQALRPAVAVTWELDIFTFLCVQDAIFLTTKIYEIATIPTVGSRTLPATTLQSYERS